MTAEKTTTKKKSKKIRKVREGRVYIRSTYNNTQISVTDAAGNVLVWSSAGRAGFNGARKSTPYAAQRVIADAMERLKPFGMEEARIYVKGIGSARESAVRALAAAGLSITSIRDMTPIPHNGVRAPKRRRV
ncbi:MAG: 30S ribosomal protein S11 [Candidatus Andersenbacteria bacterium]|nr:30S ribosomal protein S11 [bacterium]MDZ4225832.1 30S ribosomal protein S11 [Candidatus Andersenbacteria bacterium]